MLIKFEIQLDESSGATVVTANPAPNPASPAKKELADSFAAQKGAAGGDDGGISVPVGDPGTGVPGGAGTLIVVGPIVICGSGPGHTSPGGSAPVGDPGTGTPGNKTNTTASETQK
jgi:hypothetical protein